MITKHRLAISFFLAVLISLSVLSLYCNGNTEHSADVEPKLAPPILYTKLIRETLYESSPPISAYDLPPCLLGIFDRHGNGLCSIPCNNFPEDFADDFYTLDDSGNIVESLSYNSSGPEFRYIYQYDPEGKIIEVVTFSLTNPDIDVLAKSVLEYAGNGKLETVLTYAYGRTLSSKWKRPEGSEDEAKEAMYNIRDGKISMTGVDKFDLDDNRISSTLFDEEGALISEIVESYDTKGNMIDQWIHNFIDSESTYKTFNYVEFDKYDNWILRSVELQQYDGTAQESGELRREARISERRIMVYYDL
ncbi:hypothetical protein ACFLU3_04620 [Chloroflexota bacterium]